VASKQNKLATRAPQKQLLYITQNCELRNEEGRCPSPNRSSLSSAEHQQGMPGMQPDRGAGGSGA
jgi:hypothetical protein